MRICLNLFDHLPAASTVEEIEALLPWTVKRETSWPSTSKEQDQPPAVRRAIQGRLKSRPSTSLAQETPVRG